MPNVKIKLGAKGHKCHVEIDGVDVSHMISSLSIRAIVDGPTVVELLGYDVDEDGKPYRSGDDVAQFCACFFVDGELKAEGDAAVVELLLKKARRLEKKT